MASEAMDVDTSLGGGANDTAVALAGGDGSREMISVEGGRSDGAAATGPAGGVASKAKLPPIVDEKQLAELIADLDEYSPLFPESIIKNHLERSGCAISDPRLVKLVALHAHKFAHLIAKNSHDMHKFRGMKGHRKLLHEKSTALNLLDLKTAMSEFHVGLERPDVFQSDAGRLAEEAQAKAQAAAAAAAAAATAAAAAAGGAGGK